MTKKKPFYPKQRVDGEEKLPEIEWPKPDELEKIIKEFDEKSNLCNLPQDMTNEIKKYLGLNDILNARRVSKDWNKLFSQDNRISLSLYLFKELNQFLQSTMNKQHRLTLDEKENASKAAVKEIKNLAERHKMNEVSPQESLQILKNAIKNYFTFANVAKQFKK